VKVTDPKKTAGKEYIAAADSDGICRSFFYGQVKGGSVSFAARVFLEMVLTGQENCCIMQTIQQYRTLFE